VSYLAGTQQTVGITVSQPPSISLTVSPGSPWKLNQTITLAVSLQGTPPANANTANFYMVLQSGGGSLTIQLGSATLQQTSPVPTYQATLQVTLVSPMSYSPAPGVTQQVPVYGPVTFYATVGSVQSNQVSGVILIPTKFTGISVSPSTIYPNQTVTVSGTLEALSTAVYNQWVPVAGQTISYTLVNSSGTKITSGSVTTNSNGNFTITFTAPSTPGSYTLDIVFAGSSSAYLAPAGLNISFGQTSAPTKLSTTDLAIIVGGLAALGGVAAYEASKRKK
jgi:Bacterial Ig-like domain (group 1).